MHTEPWRPWKRAPSVRVAPPVRCCCQKVLCRRDRDERAAAGAASPGGEPPTRHTQTHRERDRRDRHESKSPGRAGTRSQRSTGQPIERWKPVGWARMMAVGGVGRLANAPSWRSRRAGGAATAPANCARWACAAAHPHRRPEKRATAALVSQAAPQQVEGHCSTQPRRRRSS